MSDNLVFFSIEGFLAMHRNASITRLPISRFTICLPITPLVLAHHSAETADLN